MSLQVNYTVTSHQGLVRSSNEDIIEAFAFSIVDTAGATLRIHGMLVCDGMGGLKAGETASRLASISVMDYIKAMPFWPSIEADIKQQLSDAIISAHQNITMLSEYDFDKNGMGTTIVLLLIVKNKAHIMWSGDSRAYILTSRTIDHGINTAGIQLLTCDHSASWDMVAKGILTVDQARNHPQSHALTQSLGGIQTPKPDYISIAVEDGDRFMLCTDGVYLHLDSVEIKTCLHNHNDLELAAQAMSKMILERGAKDNFSIGILDIVKVQFAEPTLKVTQSSQQQNQSGTRGSWFKWWIVLPMFVVLGGLMHEILKKSSYYKTQTENGLSLEHAKIDNNLDHKTNTIKLGEKIKILEQENRKLQEIVDRMVIHIAKDTLSFVVGDEITATSLKPSTKYLQNPERKADNVSKSKPSKPSNQKTTNKEQAKLYDNIYNDVLKHFEEFKTTHPNSDIYQQAYMIRLEQLLIEIRGKRDSNDYSNSMKTNWQLEYLRNKFDMIQSKYKPE